MIKYKIKIRLFLLYTILILSGLFFIFVAGIGFSEKEYRSCGVFISVALLFIIPAIVGMSTYDYKAFEIDVDSITEDYIKGRIDDQLEEIKKQINKK